MRDVAVPALALGVWSGRDRNVGGDLPSSSVGGASSTPAQALARAKRRRAASLPASCSSRKSTSALSSPTTSAWRPSPRSASMRPPARPAAARRAGGDLRRSERLTCEFGQRRSPPWQARRGAPLPLGDRLHALERRQSLIAADCEHSRMVGALLHGDAGAVLALHDRRRRRPGHDATGRTARPPVAALSAISVRCDPRSAE